MQGIGSSRELKAEFEEVMAIPERLEGIGESLVSLMTELEDAMYDLDRRRAGVSYRRPKLRP